MRRKKGKRKKPILLACLVVTAVIAIGFVSSVVLGPSPPKIPVFPYIMENEQESTSSDTNPWWPDGWSANMYHAFTSPLSVSTWYQITLEDLGWIIEVDNFGAYQSSENVINANTLLIATKDKWVTMVAVLGWYIPETVDLGESLIIVAQGSRKGLSYLISKFSKLTPESFENWS